jgi:hypothetical protein
LFVCWFQDAQDIASSLPDEQSIMTYVSFFPIYYNNKLKREEEIRQHELQKLQTQAEVQKNLEKALKEVCLFSYSLFFVVFCVTFLYFFYLDN